MKKLTASFLTFSLLAVSCNFLTRAATPAPSNTPDIFSTSTATPFLPNTPDPINTLPPSNIPNILDTPWDDFSIFKDGLVASAQPVLDKLTSRSVYHIELNIADNLYELTGREDVRYTNNETVPLTEIHFRLFPNILGGEMQISNLNVD